MRSDNTVKRVSSIVQKDKNEKERETNFFFFCEKDRVQDK